MMKHTRFDLDKGRLPNETKTGILYIANDDDHQALVRWMDSGRYKVIIHSGQTSFMAWDGYNFRYVVVEGQPRRGFETRQEAEDWWYGQHPQDVFAEGYRAAGVFLDGKGTWEDGYSFGKGTPSDQSDPTSDLVVVGDRYYDSPGLYWPKDDDDHNWKPEED
jgi:hypothetical protein